MSTGTGPHSIVKLEVEAMSAHIARYIVMQNAEMQAAVEETLRGFDFVAAIRAQAEREAYRITSFIVSESIRKALESAEISVSLERAARTVERSC